MNEGIINNRFELILKITLPYINLFDLFDITIVSKYIKSEVLNHLKWKCTQNYETRDKAIVMKPAVLNYITLIEKRCCICLKKRVKFNHTWNIFIHEKCLRPKLKNLWYYPLIPKKHLPYKEYEGYMPGLREIYTYFAAWEKQCPIINDKETIEWYTKNNRLYLWNKQAKDLEIEKENNIKNEIEKQKNIKRLNLEKKRKVFYDKRLAKINIICDKYNLSKDDIKSKKYEIIVGDYLDLRITTNTKLKTIESRLKKIKLMSDNKNIKILDILNYLNYNKKNIKIFDQKDDVDFDKINNKILNFIKCLDSNKKENKCMHTPSPYCYFNCCKKCCKKLGNDCEYHRNKKI